MGLAEVVAANKEHILQVWEKTCHERLAVVRRVPRSVLRNSMPKLVDALVTALKDPAAEKARDEAAREHADDRVYLGDYSLTEMVFEYRLFRQVLIRSLRERTDLTPQDADFINDFIDDAIQKATAEYVAVETANAKRFEENALRLRETESQLSLALTNAQAGTWTLDIATNRLFGSAQISKIYGIDALDGDLSQTIRGLVSPEDQKRLREAMMESIRTREPMAVDFKIRRPDGSERWSHVRGSVSYDPSGKPIRLSGIQTDVTEQKEAELRLREAKDEAERANSAKSAFLANMSHEIRTPLGAIMGFSELLKTNDLRHDDLLKYVNVIDRNAKHLLNVIDDILDLSKVEAGRMTIETIDFSLSDLLDDFASIMSYRAHDKGIEFLVKKRRRFPSA